MKIAVIGGGAAGMTSAHYLARRHDVVLFEKQPQLGGNIRTLGKNAASGSLPEGLVLDNGVIEFLQGQSPRLNQLLTELGTQTQVTNFGSSGLFLANGRHIHAPGAIRRSGDLMQQLRGYSKLLGTLVYLPAILVRLLLNRNNRFGDVLGNDDLSNWMRMLTMYGFSMPYQSMDQFPLDVAKGALIRGRPGVSWMRICGGVYSYLQAIEDRGEFEIRTGVQGIIVARETDRVRVHDGDHNLVFDRVVIATPPHEVPGLLADATSQEARLFSGWQGNDIETIIHTDASIYDRWAPSEMTEFDVFEKNGGRDAGYNAYLNRLAGIPATSPHYFLAYNMTDWVDPAQIVQRQAHTTTWFSADNTRHEIRALNGINHTWYAGAWLEDGLHEGAIASAVNVARGLGISV